MNIRLVIGQLGLIILVLSVILFVMAGTFFLAQTWLDHSVDPAAKMALILTGIFGTVLGGVMWLSSRGGPKQLGRREALLLVAVSWLLGAAFSGLPYLTWAHLSEKVKPDHPFFNPINCYFEAMSGLTTTGATVLSNIEAIPNSLLLWRSLTHWLGGLGIVVLFVAVLPTLGVGGKRLFTVEAPGPSHEGVRPQIRETARILWLIYLGLTVAEIVALWLAGMTPFDAVCHTFATLATGGFSTQNASIGAYKSVWIETIIIVFMLLAGINFGLYYHIFQGRLRRIFKDVELRVYLIILLAASVIVIGSLIDEQIISGAGEESEPSVSSAIRHGVFQVVAIQTTTGFITADFNQWGFLPKATLVALMFIGASAGSTGGGIKVIRIWVALKIMFAEIERVFRPNVIRPVKLGTRAIDPDLKLTVMSYILGILLLFFLGAIALMLLEPTGEIDFTTAATASAATLNNIGPGLARVGAIENFGWFSGAGKLVMSVLMALGRLEIFAIIVLFSPYFWRNS